MYLSGGSMSTESCLISWYRELYIALFKHIQYAVRFKYNIAESTPYVRNFWVTQLYGKVVTEIK